MNTPAPQGHNRDGQLKAYVERMQALEEAKREKAEDQKELAKEIKSSGYSPKLVRKKVKANLTTAAEQAKQEREQAEYDAMCAALGPF